MQDDVVINRGNDYVTNKHHTWSRGLKSSYLRLRCDKTVPGELKKMYSTVDHFAGLLCSENIPRPHSCAGLRKPVSQALRDRRVFSAWRCVCSFMPFGCNSKHRALVTPAKRGKGNKTKLTDEGQEQTPAERRAWPRPASRPVPGLTFSMSWAQRLKRVFNIDIETCRECGGAVRIMPKALATLAGQALACIEDSVVIDKILTHLQEKLTPVPAGLRPASRAPPVDLFG